MLLYFPTMYPSYLHIHGWFSITWIKSSHAPPLQEAWEWALFWDGDGGYDSFLSICPLCLQGNMTLL